MRTYRLQFLANSGLLFIHPIQWIPWLPSGRSQSCNPSTFLNAFSSPSGKIPHMANFLSHIRSSFLSPHLTSHFLPHLRQFFCLFSLKGLPHQEEVGSTLARSLLPATPPPSLKRWGPCRCSPTCCFCEVIARRGESEVKRDILSQGGLEATHLTQLSEQEAWGKNRKVKPRSE